MSKWTLEDRGLALRVDRRTLVRGGLLGGAGLAAAALIGCGDDDDDEEAGGGAATTTATSTPTSTPTATEESGGGEKASDETPGDVLVTPGGNEVPLNYPDPPGTPKVGGVYKQAQTYAIGPMDPTQSAAAGTIAPGRAAYNRVIGFLAGPEADPYNIELRPELAGTWEQSEDGASYTFHLRDGIRWQNVDPLNGRDFTSADVKYAWDRYAASGAQAQYWTNLNEITTPDPQTVVVTLNQPEPDFLVPLGSRYLTIHPQELVDDGTITTRAIGTGPMIQTEVTDGERVAFEKNPDYFDGEVLLDGMEHLIMPDHQTQLAQFRVGQIDDGLAVLSGIEELDALLETNPDTRSTWGPVTNTYFEFSFNLSDPRFADERVRRALSLAIDRHLMEDLAWSGYGKALPTIPWFYLFDEVPTEESGLLGEWWRYDPTEAKKLLQAAGQEDLSFTMIMFPYSAGQSSAAEIQAENYKDIGVDMALNVADYTEFNSQWIEVSYAEAADGWAANGFTPDNYFYNLNHSTAPGNRYNINDAQIDEWAEAQRIELDPDARKELWLKIWDRLNDQVWRIDKPFGQSAYVYQPWVRGVRYVGPLLSNYAFTALGEQVDKAWLDK